MSCHSEPIFYLLSIDDGLALYVTEEKKEKKLPVGPSMSLFTFYYPSSSVPSSPCKEGSHWPWVMTCMQIITPLHGSRPICWSSHLFTIKSLTVRVVKVDLPRKRKSKNDGKVFSLSCWENGVAIARQGRHTANGFFCLWTMVGTAKVLGDRS